MPDEPVLGEGETGGFSIQNAISATPSPRVPVVSHDLIPGIQARDSRRVSLPVVRTPGQSVNPGNGMDTRNLSGSEVITEAVPPAIQWKKCYGGAGRDEATSIRQTRDGGYIVAGLSESRSGQVTGNHGGPDFWVVKLTRTGAITWKKSLGGADWDHATEIEQTSDGGYIVVGSADSRSGQVIGNHGGTDFWVVKLNQNGGITWRKCLGGTDWDHATDIGQTSDGGYIVIGTTQSRSGQVTGNHGGSDFWVVKLNRNGAISWRKCYGGPGQDDAMSIRQTIDGGYIVAGSTYSNSGQVTGNHGGSDIWVLKLNRNGAISWKKCYGGPADEYVSGIRQTSDGGYIVAGTTSSNSGQVTGNHGASDFWVIKLNRSGAISWKRCYGGTGYDVARDVEQTRDGGYVVTGYNDGFMGYIKGNHGRSDYWVIKLTRNGAVAWERSLGGLGYDEGMSIRQTIDGGYIVAGSSEMSTGQVIGNHGYKDYWIVKLKG